ncbi:MAG: hypothetical protein ACERKZ_21925 [Lachnotalea sp.]
MYDTWGTLSTGISLGFCFAGASVGNVTATGAKQSIQTFLGSGASNIAKSSVSFGAKTLLTVGSGAAVEKVVTPYTSKDFGQLSGLLAGGFVGSKLFGVKATEVKGSSNLGKGAYNGNVYDGSGFGKLADKEISVSQKGIDIIKEHLSGEFSDITNDAMIKSLESALLNGEKITGANASFYMHEITETSMMSKGMSYKIAHELSLEKYDVSPFSVYSPEVISEYPKLFGKPFKKFWGID